MQRLKCLGINHGYLMEGYMTQTANRCKLVYLFYWRALPLNFYILLSISKRADPYILRHLFGSSTATKYDLDTMCRPMGRFITHDPEMGTAHVQRALITVLEI